MKHVILSLPEWKLISLEAKKAVFGWDTAPEDEECDYAFFFTMEDDTPLGFVTVKDRGEGAYLQFGGMFDVHKGTPYAMRMFECVLRSLQEKTKVITMKVKNTNTPMLRLALKCDFIPVGINYWKSCVFVTLQRGGL